MAVYVIRELQTYLKFVVSTPIAVRDVCVVHFPSENINVRWRSGVKKVYASRYYIYKLSVGFAQCRFIFEALPRGWKDTILYRLREDSHRNSKSFVHKTICAFVSHSSYIGCIPSRVFITEEATDSGFVC